MGVVALNKIASTASPHPNEFYRRRIARALSARRRYKYVEPTVLPAPEGYRIESPCCSRKIDPEGGIIDIALLTYEADADMWSLSRKEHKAQVWLEDRRFQRLSDLLDYLNIDPSQKFWQ